MPIKTILEQPTNVQVQKVDTPQGTIRVVIFEDAAGNGISVPLVQEAWAALMTAGSGITIANGMPPTPPA
jgi:hypothetical protein